MSLFSAHYSGSQVPTLSSASKKMNIRRPECRLQRLRMPISTARERYEFGVAIDRYLRPSGIPPHFGCDHVTAVPKTDFQVAIL